MDNIPLASFDGLSVIPIDILIQGSGASARFLMDLFNFPEGTPQYRSRLILVGQDRATKLATLDFLFPLTGWLQSQGLLKKTAYWYRVQGAQFCKFDSPTDVDPHKNKTVVLDKAQWEMVELPDTLGIKLVPRRKGGGEEGTEFRCPNRETYDVWLPRIARTLGLGPPDSPLPKKIVVSTAITEEHFKAHRLRGELRLDVFDLASPHDLDYAHTLFLAKRSIFVVLWRLDEGPEGLTNLRLWFSTLAPVLATPAGSPVAAGLYTSILVLGLCGSQSALRREERNLRAQQVDQLAHECGLLAPLQYHEVNTDTLADIDVVQESLCRTALSHTHMGERLPRPYLGIWEDLERERERRRSLPIMEVKDLVQKYFDEGLVRRALSLLSLYGECVYFDSPAEVSHATLLDSGFMAREILADLLQVKEGGQMKHGDLIHRWARFRPMQRTAEEFLALIMTLVRFLERLEVGFVRREEAERGARKRSFLDLATVVPCLLPEKPRDLPPSAAEYPSRFQRVWPVEPPADRPVELARVLTFNLFLPEFANRLFVRLHLLIKDQLVWRNDMLVALAAPSTAPAAPAPEQALGWISVDPQANIVGIKIRGVNQGSADALLARILSTVRDLVDSRYPTMRWGESSHAWEREACTE